MEHINLVNKNRSDNFPGSIADVAEFNIYRYYDSWLLRGDSPELYCNGFYKEPHSSEIFRIINTNNRIKKARLSSEAQYLYYMYH